MAKKLPKIISEEEFLKLHDAAKKIESKSKKRKHTIREFRLAMILGFYSGLRISEIVGFEDRDKTLASRHGKGPTQIIWRVPKLTKDNIEDSHIRINSGKGQKDRIVPRPRLLNQNAIDMLPLKIGRRSIQRFITKLGKDVLGKEISFHTLRHGFVTLCIEKGMDLHEVQMFAGHSRLDTTGIYLHANPKKALDKYKDLF